MYIFFCITEVIEVGVCLFNLGSVVECDDVSHVHDDVPGVDECSDLQLEFPVDGEVGAEERVQADLIMIGS